MPYTSQNVVVSIFLTLVSYLLPVCCVAGCMKKSHSKKWVFGVVIACILPASLLWTILHFASGASHNVYPALIWGCIAFAMLSARNDVIKNGNTTTLRNLLKLKQSSRKMEQSQFR